MKCLVAMAALLVTAGMWASADEPVVKHPEAREIQVTPPHMASKTPAEQIVTVRGKVRTQSDAEGALAAIFLEGEDGVEYRLMVTPETKPIAALHGRRVEVMALLEMKAGVAWLALRSFNLNPAP